LGDSWPSRRWSSYSSIREIKAGEENGKMKTTTDISLLLLAASHHPVPSLTLIQLLRLLLQKVSAFQPPQLIHAENMKPRYPLMTLDILLYTPMPLISEILTNPSGSISQEMVGVFQGG